MATIEQIIKERKAINQINAEVMTITPAMAAEMLTRNLNNRPISKPYVRMLADEIKSGNWETTNQGIGFSVNGTLIDGQHRLAAIVLANIPASVIVVTGLPSNTNAVDGNRKRSTSNRLVMGGIPADLASPKIVSAINALIVLCSDTWKPTVTRAERFIEKKGEMLAEAVSIARAGGKRPVGDKAACFAAAFCALYNGLSPRRLERFFEVVNSGFAGGDSESSAIVFRNYLLSDAPKNNGHKDDYMATFVQCTKAIKDFCNNTPRRRPYSGDPVFFDKVKVFIEKEIL